MADLDAYRQAICNDRLRGEPEKAWDALTWTWNACQREVPNWPALVIDRPVKREIYLLRWSAFPASLKQDADAYLARLAGQDLSGEGPARPARPATLKTRAYQMQVAASALVHSGVPAEQILSLADLVSMANYQAILRFFLARHGGQTSPMVGQIAGFLKDVARHHVKADEDAIAKMKRIVANLTPPRHDGEEPRASAPVRRARKRRKFSGTARPHPPGRRQGQALAQAEGHPRADRHGDCAFAGGPDPAQESRIY